MSREMAEKVHRAIEAGVGAIRRRQAQDGWFFQVAPDSVPVGAPAPPQVEVDCDTLATTALAMHTLLSCGVRADDPAVERALRKAWDWYIAPDTRKFMLDTYTAGLMLLALRSLRGNRPEQVQPRPAGAHPNEAELQTWVRELGSWILKEARSGEGGFGYGHQKRETHDHSNSQYAILGLRAAAEMGFDAGRDVWAATLRHMIKMQERSGPRVDRFESRGVGEFGYGWARTRVSGDGVEDRARGWGYQGQPAKAEKHGQHPCTGSMTAAGVYMVAICRDQLRSREALPEVDDRAAERSIWDGLGWLGHNFSVERNPGARDAVVLMDGGPLDRDALEEWRRRGGAALGGELNLSTHFYYYLYGLERAGIASGAAWMGEHDWYGEGAAYLVRVQMRNGLWNAVPIDTCFALLFLRRADTRAPRGAVTGDISLDLSPERADALDDKSLRDVFDEAFRRLVEARREERIREGLKSLVALGPRVIPLLIRHLEAAESEPRRVAAMVLAGITVETPRFDADADDATRAVQTRNWEEWWMANGPRLRRDTARGLLIVG